MGLLSNGTALSEARRNKYIMGETIRAAGKLRCSNKVRVNVRFTIRVIFDLELVIIYFI